MWWYPNEWGPEWDVERYPDPLAMVKAVHAMNLTLMVSYWSKYVHAMNLTLMVSYWSKYVPQQRASKEGKQGTSGLVLKSSTLYGNLVHKRSTCNVP
jgi:alpha-glucosidase (family GH31 glycosyl hydrolase)